MKPNTPLRRTTALGLLWLRAWMSAVQAALPLHHFEPAASGWAIARFSATATGTTGAVTLTR